MRGIELAPEFGRDGAFDPDRLRALRKAELYRRGVEEEPSLGRAAASGPVAARSAVARVAEDRMPGSRELDANLVLPSRFQEYLYEAGALSLGEHSPLRDGALGALLARPGDAHEELPVLDEIRVEDSLLRFHPPLDQGDVAAFRDDLLPSRHKEALDGGVHREDDDAGGVAVDAVDDGGAALWVVLPNALRGDVQ